MNQMSKFIASEAQEQATLFSWAELMSNRDPRFCLMHHVPNGGSRNAAEARNLKRQGVKSGVPDICFPVPSNGYHGLYIELKRTHGGRLSKEQVEWIRELNLMGYLAVVCYGFEDAKGVIERYLYG